MKTPVPNIQVFRANGFVLIVTVSLMILLALLAIGLLSLSAIGLRGGSLGQARTEARANARLALAIAFGELQKRMGPDQRISARGDVLARDPRIDADIPPASPKAWWVGVAHGDPEQTLGDGEPVAWLISGLDTASGASSRLHGSFSNTEPVRMFGENSLDLEKYTLGEPIEAGRVRILDSEGEAQGTYAWIIDDNGMKAQLAPTNRSATNRENAGLGVLAGGYDLTILDGLESLYDQSPEAFAKLTSRDELRFLGGPPGIAASKRFAFTARSQGVLADARFGGLKRDLTMAFENERAFDRAFPSRDRNRYLVMNAEKFEDAPDLARNGYIHFGMLRDYYNLKRHIQENGSTPFLYPTIMLKTGFLEVGGGPFFQGGLGPHQMGSGDGLSGVPYGEFSVFNQQRVQESYRGSPITPVLAMLQQNAWIEEVPGSRSRNPSLETRTQMFTSHYNPYNIGINMRGDIASSGTRVINFPQVRFTLSGRGGFSNVEGLADKRQSHSPAFILPPGRSQLLGFPRDAFKGQESDDALYSYRIAQVANESIRFEVDGSSRPGGNATLRVDFTLDRPALISGVDERSGDHEAAQYFFSPFSWDDVGGAPGKRREETAILGPSQKLSMIFALRTTGESDGSSLRPLVDANVRAIWNNPKWDSPLDLPSLAAYSVESAGEPPGALIPMDLSENPKAFGYWGADRSPGSGFERVILFDVPRRDLVSIGQLQHANIGRFSYEPSYIIGNSYANPRLTRDDWKTRIRDTYSRNNPGLSQWSVRGDFNLYDASYLVNEVLWDSYTFTTIPQADDNFTGDDTPADFAALRDGDLLLPNPRYLPYESPGSKFQKSTLQQVGPSDSGSVFHNAGHLLVDGAFNVNSTSVDAWEAFLSGTSELPVQRVDENGNITGFEPPGEGVRFTRVNATLGEGADGGRNERNFWIGFRSLQQSEVRELAAEIVEQIRERGPSYGLGEFVNRRLEAGEFGESGPLQAALDATVNESLDAGLGDDASHPRLPGDPSQATGFPGYLLQGDVLQALAPYMNARSDSFTIRAYGESLNPDSGRIEARAWCEATVQRYPDPLPSPGAAADDPLKELANPSGRFGRRFRVTSFRWLDPEEI